MDFWPASAVRRDVRLHSRDVEEVRAFLQRLPTVRLDVAARDAPQFSACINGVILRNMAILYTHYGTQVSAFWPDANCDCWVLPPIRGHFEAFRGKTGIDCGPDRAYVASPMRGHLLRTQEGSSRLSVRLRGAALIQQLSALLGEPVNAPLELTTELCLADGYGRNIAAHLYQAMADLESGHSPLCDPVTASSFEQFIMTGLLLSHPHNFSDALRRLEKPIAPRDVKRAIDYIEGHLDSVVTLADLVAASRVPGRTLFKHFKEYRGVSPMRYLRAARFKRVRDELRRLEPEQSVMDVATRWGFAHMGRFAVEYRKQFGESPSQTLGKRRLRS
jgi:AraC-like DNA-binding protein